MQVWHTVDKQGWPRGPWDDEPDKAHWRDEATGLNCLIVRNERLGHLCGYVGVPRGHACHGKGYDDLDFDVHGGLTFANGCSHSDDPARGICHVTAPGESDDVWWLGFDCAHFMDRSPGVEVRELMRHLSPLDRDSTYRTVDYVRAECASLARQVVAHG